VSGLIARGIAWLPRLFVAVIIVVAAAAIAGWVKENISSAFGGLAYGRALATGAQVIVLVLGIIAALNQVDIASSVVTPVLWAFLFAVTGILVVGVGGGLIKPMQHRWERMLNRAETESTIAAERVRANRARAASARESTMERDRNAPGGFDQPAYGGSMPSDTQPPATPARADYSQYEEYPEESRYEESPPRSDYER
jgi:hypothetical protein